MTVTIATTTLTSALTYHAPVVNVGLTVKATDSCVANGSLPVTIKLWSNQALRNGGTDGQGQVREEGGAAIAESGLIPVRLPVERGGGSLPSASWPA